MARKHAFFIVVLLAAAALAGFVALARSADLAQPAAATATPTLSQSALEKRLRELDRFEAKLRKQLAAKPPARAAQPATVITRAAAPAPAVAYDDDEHEDEDEDEHEDEEHEDDDD
jgi:hypothetical protein